MPTPKSSLKDHLFSSKSNFNQTLVFMNQKQNVNKWSVNKETLCFSFENYKEKIKTIIDKLHFKIDLSEDFQGWDFLQAFKILNYNHLSISDGYILSDKKDQKIIDNLVPSVWSPRLPG